MPQSRHRHKHPHAHHAAPATHAPHAPKKSAVPMMIIFIGLLGFGIALIAAGTNWIWLLAGIMLGAISGYFIGKSMDRTAAADK
ncbi:MAG: hypothetical protein QM731_06320 [Chitinophagaceae bacterium]